MRLISFAGIALVVCTAGCVGVAEVRDEVNKVKDRNRALAARLDNVELGLKRMKKDLVTRQDLEVLRREDLEGLKATVSRLAEEVRNVRQDFTYSLDEALSGVRKDVQGAKQKAEAAAKSQAAFEKNVQKKLSTVSSDVSALRASLDQLAKRVGALEKELSALKKETAGLRTSADELARAQKDSKDRLKQAEDRISALQSTIETLKKELSALKKAGTPPRGESSGPGKVKKVMKKGGGSKS